MVTTYETELLDPIWWINSLLGDWFLAVVIIEIWLLSFMRQIPNIHAFSFILFALNIMIMVYAVFSGVGITLGTGLMTLMLIIYAIIFWSSYNDS